LYVTYVYNLSLLSKCYDNSCAQTLSRFVTTQWDCLASSLVALRIQPWYKKSGVSFVDAQSFKVMSQSEIAQDVRIQYGCKAHCIAVHLLHFVLHFWAFLIDYIMTRDIICAMVHLSFYIMFRTAWSCTQIGKLADYTSITLGPRNQHRDKRPAKQDDNQSLQFFLLIFEHSYAEIYKYIFRLKITWKSNNVQCVMI